MPPSPTKTKRALMVVAFLSVLLLFFFISTWVVYLVIAIIFSVTSPLYLDILGSGLGILGLSLIISTILGMKYYNIFTRVYSLISSVWIGYFVYLFLGSVIYGILIIPFGVVPMVGYLMIALVVIVGTYGLIHATNIHVKEVEVHLKNFPESWHQRKAIWISDLHLGQIHGPLFLEKVIEKIKTIPHSIIFIGGDLFDGTSAPDLSKFLTSFKKVLPELGIYFVTGNHEEFGNNTKFLSAINSAGIKVLADQLVMVDGLQIIGVDYENASNKNNFKKILSSLNIDRNNPSILLKHEPKDIDIAREAGISLQVSGHTHRAQLWPLEYLPRLIYKGYFYGLKKYIDMQVYVSSGVGTWGPPMRVGTNSEIVVFTFLK